MQNERPQGLTGTRFIMKEFQIQLFKEYHFKNAIQSFSLLVLDDLKLGLVKQTFQWGGEDKNCSQLFLIEQAKRKKRSDDTIILHLYLHGIL